MDTYVEWIKKTNESSGSYSDDSAEGSLLAWELVIGILSFVGLVIFVVSYCFYIIKKMLDKRKETTNNGTQDEEYQE